MPVRFVCPCGRRLRTPDGNAGKIAQCLQCKRWLRIPAVDSPGAVASETNAPLAGATQHSDEDVTKATEVLKARIVVADGFPPDLTVTARMLREHGYFVYDTGDGVRAVELIRGERPDTAVLDIRLDGIGGFQVLQQLRNPQNPLNKDVFTLPVIMTTSKLRGRDKQYAMSLGVANLLEKPVTPGVFCERIDKVISRHHAH